MWSYFFTFFTLRCENFKLTLLWTRLNKWYKVHPLRCNINFTLQSNTINLFSPSLSEFQYPIKYIMYSNFSSCIACMLHELPHLVAHKNLHKYLQNIPSTVHESIASSPGFTITFSDMDFIAAPSVEKCKIKKKFHHGPYMTNLKENSYPSNGNVLTKSYCCCRR